MYRQPHESQDRGEFGVQRRTDRADARVAEAGESARQLVDAEVDAALEVASPNHFGELREIDCGNEGFIPLADVLEVGMGVDDEAVDEVGNRCGHGVLLNKCGCNGPGLHGRPQLP